MKFGAYMIRIVMSSWTIVALNRMKFLSLSLLINFGVKSILSGIRIVRGLIPGPIFLEDFIHPFTFKVRYTFFRQKKRWIMILNPFN